MVSKAVNTVIGFTVCTLGFPNMTAISRLIVACALMLLAACATAPHPGPAPHIDSAAPAVDVYHIGVDDELKIDVWHNPDLSVAVPVRPDGRISVPLIGDVHSYWG